MRQESIWGDHESHSQRDATFVECARGIPLAFCDCGVFKKNRQTRNVNSTHYRRLTTVNFPEWVEQMEGSRCTC